MSLKSMFKGMRRGGNTSPPWPRHLVEHAEDAKETHAVWADLPPELLRDIIQRVEAGDATWPGRRNLVACASACQSWREVTKELIETPERSGKITLPISLKQPGPRNAPIQCFVRRDRASGTFGLYMGLSPSLNGENDKLLLAARKIRGATSTGFVVSLSSKDFSRSSSTYVGKLRSNFLGTKFTVHDTQPLKDTSYFPIFQRKPRNKEIATISYELNVLRRRGPRRLHCTLPSIPVSSLQEGGSVPDQECGAEPLVLKNKLPRWHEQLQCWCLNFRGRVTVASVKNFQLVAEVQPSHMVSLEEQEKVILQFGKIGKDIFTMDFRYPLSAFQAFAICLSSFDTKPVCE